MQGPICYRAYDKNPNLCPVRAIADYMVIRNELTSYDFYIISRKSWSPASRDTIARWLKDCMGEAGVNLGLFTAHSCRSASTSAANRGGVPLETILSHGDWSNAKTFFTHYLKELQTVIGTGDAFSDTLLNNANI